MDHSCLENCVFSCFFFNVFLCPRQSLDLVPGSFWQRPALHLLVLFTVTRGPQWTFTEILESKGVQSKQPQSLPLGSMGRLYI